MLNFPGLRGPADVRGRMAPMQEHWALPKKEGKARKGPGTPADASQTRPVPAGNNVQHEGWILGGFATRVCLDLLYELSVLLCHADMMMLHDLSLCASRQTFRAKTKTSSDAFSFIKNLKACVYLYPKVVCWHTLQYTWFIFSETSEVTEKRKFISLFTFNSLSR